MSMRPAFFALTGVTVAATIASCAEASGEVKGGESSVDTTPPDFIGCDQTELIDAGSGARFSDLYRDLFGPTSAARCAAPSCHGSPEGEGTHAGFACYPDASGCRRGMIDYGLVDPEGDAAEPEKGNLYAILRHCGPERQTIGIMPKSPRGYYFSKASLARVADWIRQGAKDD